MTPALRDFIIRDIGCLCCLIEGINTPAEKHHMLTTGLHGNGKRLGEMFTIGLCSWHHRGEHDSRYGDADYMADGYGPSYALHASRFRERYGNDAELLQIQNSYIAEWQRNTV